MNNVYDSVIVGAGISGLSLGFYLKRKNKNILLLEKGNTCGGFVQSELKSAFLCEHGPNGFLQNATDTLELISLLGLENSLIDTRLIAKKRYIVKNGKLKPLFQTPNEFIFSDLLSFKAKMRLFLEPFIKIDTSKDWSVREFFEKKIGKEITQTLIDPMITGIHAGNINTLSFKYALKKFYNYYNQYGSFFKALIYLQRAVIKDKLATKTANKKSGFATLASFKNGMGEITLALKRYLENNIKINTSVEDVKLGENNTWILKSHGDIFYAKNLIFATPAYVTSKYIEKYDNNLANLLFNIKYPPIKMITFGFEDSELEKKLNGFGCLVPSREKADVLGILWNSSIFTNRSAVGKQNVTIIMGGANNPQAGLYLDEKAKVVALEYFNHLIGLNCKPIFNNIYSYERSIPQLEVGFEKVMSSVEGFNKKFKNVYFTGNYISGVGINDCISYNKMLADRI